MALRVLTALPVYNEERHVRTVVETVKRYCPEVLVVVDGSTDRTPALVAEIEGIHVVRHATNQGYGAALQSAFDYAQQQGFDVLVTIDCDGQHEPCRIPELVAALGDADLVSGSRYLRHFEGDSAPPIERRRINLELTALLNDQLGLHLTDAFCGFKAYRVASLQSLRITERGYAMPLELWVQAVHAGWKIREFPVPLIYLDEKRSFGGALNDAEERMKYYRQVLERAQAAIKGASTRAP